MRGFETIEGYNGVLPTRGSEHSAGYDFYAPEDVYVRAGMIKTFQTGIKAYMPKNEFLQMHIRSSVGIRKKLMLANTTGIIDSDYYNNPDNGGHILIALYNYGKEGVWVRKGERVAQGIFLEYQTTGDIVEDKRTGGVGSTN